MFSLVFFRPSTGLGRLATFLQPVEEQAFLLSVVIRHVTTRALPSIGVSEVSTLRGLPLLLFSIRSGAPLTGLTLHATARTCPALSPKGVFDVQA